MIGIIAAVGGEVERHRQALLAGGQVAAVERVGILRGGEPGILPDGPWLVDIHRRVGAAQKRRDAGPGVEEIDAVKIGFAIAGFYQDALGREPGLGAACRCGDSGLFKCDRRKVRYSAHGYHLSMDDGWRSRAHSWSGCWWLTMPLVLSGP